MQTLNMFQLRVHAVQQVGVHRLLQPHRRSVPGEPHHQLGCHPLGEEASFVMDSPTYLGCYQPYRSSSTCVPRIQGKVYL